MASGSPPFLTTLLLITSVLSILGTVDRLPAFVHPFVFALAFALLGVVLTMNVIAVRRILKNVWRR